MPGPLPPTPLNTWATRPVTSWTGFVGLFQKSLSPEFAALAGSRYESKSTTTTKIAPACMKSHVRSGENRRPRARQRRMLSDNVKRTNSSKVISRKTTRKMVARSAV